MVIYLRCQLIQLFNEVYRQYWIWNLNLDSNATCSQHRGLTLKFLESVMIIALLLAQMYSYSYLVRKIWAFIGMQCENMNKCRHSHIILYFIFFGWRWLDNENLIVPYWHIGTDDVGLNSTVQFSGILFSGFVPVFKQKIQGLFKDFQGHISHISRTLFN